MKKLRMRPNETNGILITFCGLDGCGKTTIGKLLSKATGMSFIDTDEAIETAEGRRITDIFSLHKCLFVLCTAKLFQ